MGLLYLFMYANCVHCTTGDLFRLTKNDAPRDSVSVQPKRDPRGDNQQNAGHVVVHYVVADLMAEMKGHRQGAVTANWNTTVRKSVSVLFHSLQPESLRFHAIPRCHNG
jgi:hypothetical protein